jgi:putative FmdB family regulatory protein
VPRYDYECQSCGARFEAVHGFEEAAPACPVCSHEGVRRLILRAPAIAKGMLANAGDARGASKEQLRDKWAEETPKLRKQLSDKLGEDAVRQIPSLNAKVDGA